MPEQQSRPPGPRIAQSTWRTGCNAAARQRAADLWSPAGRSAQPGSSRWPRCQGPEWMFPRPGSAPAPCRSLRRAGTAGWRTGAAADPAPAPPAIRPPRTQRQRQRQRQRDQGSGTVKRRASGVVVAVRAVLSQPDRQRAHVPALRRRAGHGRRHWDTGDTGDTGTGSYPQHDPHTTRPQTKNRTCGRTPTRYPRSQTPAGPASPQPRGANPSSTFLHRSPRPPTRRHTVRPQRVGCVVASGRR